MTHAAVTWARAVLGADAPAELLRERPWSQTWRIQSARGPAILKATGPSSRYEAELVHELAQQSPEQVPAVWGHDAGRGWLLLADAGPTLHARATGPPRTGNSHRWDSDLAERLVVQFAELQRQIEPRADHLVERGVPDERAGRLPGIVAGLLADVPELAELTGDEQAQLRSLASSSSPAVQVLGAVPIPPSVQHGDLHDNNASPGSGDRLIFFDFGDASVAHPFMTMLIPLQQAEDHDASPQQRDRLADAYLSVYTDLAPLSQLRPVLDAALRLAWVTRATAWHRALKAAPAQHQWDQPVLHWMRSPLTASTL